VTQGASVAADERRRLALGRAPVPDVAELVRDQGVWVCGAELPGEMSGLFLKHATMGMAILVASEHVRARRRFSYAHEYGHALMDRDKDVSVTTSENRSDLREVRANAFAAAFLLPKSGVLHFLGTRQKGPEGSDRPIYDPSIDPHGAVPQVRSHLPAGARKITFEDVAAFAHYFGVSYQAAAYRLNSLRLVSRPQLQDLLEKADFGRQYLRLLKLEDGEEEESMPARELVSEVVHLAMEAFRRGEISRGKLQELSSLLGIPAQELLRLAEEA
jgi:Zn-dependent peptidase ImmA (M78 family)